MDVIIEDKSDDKPAEDDETAAPAADVDAAKPDAVAVDAEDESKAE